MLILNLSHVILIRIWVSALPAVVPPPHGGDEWIPGAEALSHVYIQVVIISQMIREVKLSELKRSQSSPRGPWENRRAVTGVQSPWRRRGPTSTLQTDR